MKAWVMPAPAPWANTKQARGRSGLVSSAETAPALPTSIFIGSASFMVLRPVGESLRYCLDIVFDQLDVGSSLPLAIGQAVRIQRSADRDTRLRGDLTYQPGVTDILQEDGRYPLGPDLGDDGCDVTCTWFAVGRNPLRRQERNVIGRGEIAESVVGGDHLA